DPGSWLVSFLGLFVLCEDLFEAFGGGHCSVVTKAGQACRQAVDGRAAISVEVRPDSHVLAVLGGQAQNRLGGPLPLRSERGVGRYSLRVQTLGGSRDLNPSGICDQFIEQLQLASLVSASG